MIARRTQVRGFSMIEAAIASVMVSVMIAGAMAVAGSAGLARYKTAERATAGALADAMIAEIMALEYTDPQGNAVFGPETGEAGTDRTRFDDVDDYDGLSESAPAQRDGTAVPGLNGWSRTVSVAFVAVGAPDTGSVADTGLKRIRVTIKHSQATVLTRQTLRSSDR